MKLYQLFEDGDIHKKNLEAIEKVLGFDGDFELGPKTRNQCDKMGTDSKGNTLWYISLNPPAADCEAYVVCDKNGNVSYYDHAHHTGVIKGKIVSHNVPRRWCDKLDDIVDEYNFEGSTVKEGGIAAYEELMKEMSDYR